MTDAPRRLLEIQEQDTVGDQLRHRRQHHPLRAELAEVTEALTELRRRHLEAVGRRDAIRRRQADLEAELAANNERLTGIERRMYSGEVSAARDLQALSSEADGLRARTSRLEDLVLEAMEEAEPAEAAVAALESEAGTLSRGRSEAEAQLEVEDAALEAEEAEHARARAALAVEVSADLLQRYDLLRSRLGGVAVASLHNGACGGCHLSLPATELDRIRKAPSDSLITCEQCGRLLVRP
ncbi:MAG TPA: C4-type zinc ribbon domain-containing protein [Acidimicrobiales bacterium]|nr:C4-type zinc ribbon domain-containing protein [Acidimicrobiales bacterium]